MHGQGYSVPSSLARQSQQGQRSKTIMLTVMLTIMLTACALLCSLKHHGIHKSGTRHDVTVIHDDISYPLYLAYILQYPHVSHSLKSNL